MMDEDQINQQHRKELCAPLSVNHLWELPSCYHAVPSNSILATDQRVQRTLLNLDSKELDRLRNDPDRKWEYVLRSKDLGQFQVVLQQSMDNSATAPGTPYNRPYNNTTLRIVVGYASAHPEANQSDFTLVQGRITCGSRQLVVIKPYVINPSDPHALEQYILHLPSLATNLSLLLIQSRAARRPNDGPDRPPFRTLAQIMSTMEAVLSAQHPLSVAAPASTETLNLMAAAHFQHQFATKNLRLVDIAGIRWPLNLAAWAAKSSLIGRRIWKNNPQTRTFQWDVYGHKNPFEVKLPFPLCSQAVVLCNEMVLVGRLPDYLIGSDPRQVTKALQLAKYMELGFGIREALAYQTILAVMFHCDDNPLTQEELRDISTRVLNSLDGYKWSERARLDPGLEAHYFQMPTLAVIFLAFLVSEGMELERITSNLYYPEMKAMVEQTMHTVTMYSN